MSGMRDALEQAMAQRNAGAAGGQPDPAAQAAPPQDPMAQACGMVGQLLMALASNPQAIQQIMASVQGGGAPPQPGVPGQ